jgi:hypothetical protein
MSWLLTVESKCSTKRLFYNQNIESTKAQLNILSHFDNIILSQAVDLVSSVWMIISMQWAWPWLGLKWSRTVRRRLYPQCRQLALLLCAAQPLRTRILDCSWAVYEPPHALCIPASRGGFEHADIMYLSSYQTQENFQDMLEQARTSIHLPQIICCIKLLMPLSEWFYYALLIIWRNYIREFWR